jgi:hypothetical protein
MDIEIEIWIWIWTDIGTDTVAALRNGLCPDYCSAAAKQPDFPRRTTAADIAADGIAAHWRYWFGCNNSYSSDTAHPGLGYDCLEPHSTTKTHSDKPELIRPDNAQRIGCIHTEPHNLESWFGGNYN